MSGGVAAAPSRVSGSAPQPVSSSAEIAAFVNKVREVTPSSPDARGRLVFALDATMSRQQTWDMACELQADMFREAAQVGNLDIRLVYYRGASECRASNWISDAAKLASLMRRIDCRGGRTQIGRVLGGPSRGGRQRRTRHGVRRRCDGGAGRRSVRQGG